MHGFLISQCHAHRSLELNRKEARKILLRRLDAIINGENSLDSIEGAKIQERKRQAAKKRRRRERAQHDAASSPTTFPSGTISMDVDTTKKHNCWLVYWCTTATMTRKTSISRRK